jgi:hypothetical protein
VVPLLLLVGDWQVVDMVTYVGAGDDRRVLGVTKGRMMLTVGRIYIGEKQLKYCRE